MTMNPSSAPCDKSKATETLDLIKTMVQAQIKDAEWNLAHAEKCYHRAQKELDTLKRAYESISTVEQEGRYE